MYQVFMVYLRQNNYNNMVLTEDYIATLPLIDDDKEGEFYAEGEFEAAVLSDFNKEADKIDALYANQG